MTGGLTERIEKILDEMLMGLIHSNGSPGNENLNKCIIVHDVLETCIITALNVGDKRTTTKYVDLMLKLRYLTLYKFSTYKLTSKAIFFLERTRREVKEFNEKMNGKYVENSKREDGVEEEIEK